MTDISILKPDPHNRRKHNPRNVGMIVDALHQVGAARSIVIDEDNTILAGNATIEAAAQAGIEKMQIVEADGDTIIAVRRRGLDAEQKRRLALFDNRTAELAEWDTEQIAADLQDSLDFNGIFDTQELADLMASVKGDPPEDPGPQIDRAAELQELWHTELGQLWELGEHRLICGDCTDRAVVERVMGGQKAQLLFTSPPYWVGKDYETQTTLAEIKAFIENCAGLWTAYTNGDGGRIIINCSTASARAINPKADVETLFTLSWWQEAMRSRNWLMRHCRIWLKHGDMAAPRVAARSDVIDQHWETIPEFLPTFYYPDGLRRGQEKIGTKWAQLGVWSDIPGERSAGGDHCAAFPCELPERYIRLYSINPEVVFDPFLGSGTTLIACERLGRKCRAIEISPAYVAVALQRWTDMTGKSPRLVE